MTTAASCLGGGARFWGQRHSKLAHVDVHCAGIQGKLRHQVRTNFEFWRHYVCCYVCGAQKNTSLQQMGERCSCCGVWQQSDQKHWLRRLKSTFGLIQPIVGPHAMCSGGYGSSNALLALPLHFVGASKAQSSQCRRSVWRQCIPMWHVAHTHIATERWSQTNTPGCAVIDVELFVIYRCAFRQRIGVFASPLFRTQALKLRLRRSIAFEVLWFRLDV